MDQSPSASRSWNKMMHNESAARQSLLSSKRKLLPLPPLKLQNDREYCAIVKLKV